MEFWGRNNFEHRISALTPKLYSIAHSWGCSKDVCDDLIQETVVTALDKQEQLRDPDAMDCWTIRILVNVHRQYLRKKKWLTSLDDVELVNDFGPACELESNRTVDNVRKAISYLSDEHKKVLLLVDMEGLSYREVSEVLDIKLGTVMSRLGRARNNLRNFLQMSCLPEEQSKEESGSTLRSVK